MKYSKSLILISAIFFVGLKAYGIFDYSGADKKTKEYFAEIEEKIEHMDNFELRKYITKLFANEINQQIKNKKIEINDDKYFFYPKRLLQSLDYYGDISFLLGFKSFPNKAFIKNENEFKEFINFLYSANKLAKRDFGIWVDIANERMLLNETSAFDYGFIHWSNKVNEIPSNLERYKQVLRDFWNSKNGIYKLFALKVASKFETDSNLLRKIYEESINTPLNLFRFHALMEIKNSNISNKKELIEYFLELKKAQDTSLPVANENLKGLAEQMLFDIGQNKREKQVVETPQEPTAKAKIIPPLEIKDKLGKRDEAIGNRQKLDTKARGDEGTKGSKASEEGNNKYLLYILILILILLGGWIFYKKRK